MRRAAGGADCRRGGDAGAPLGAKMRGGESAGAGSCLPDRLRALWRAESCWPSEQLSHAVQEGRTETSLYPRPRVGRSHQLQSAVRALVDGHIGKPEVVRGCVNALTEKAVEMVVECCCFNCYRHIVSAGYKQLALLLLARLSVDYRSGRRRVARGAEGLCGSRPHLTIKTGSRAKMVLKHLL